MLLIIMFLVLLGTWVVDVGYLVIKVLVPTTF
jgi:hypothetical protein